MEEPTEILSKGETGRKVNFKYKWFNITYAILIHMAAIYGIYLSITRAKWQTFVFAFFLYVTSSIGVTAGAHRLWSHKAYKVKPVLKTILLLFFSQTFQGSVFSWVRDHRLHHKYSDTDADPHNSTRGFFFCHIGWLLVKKHPEVISKGRTIDMSDIQSDKLLRFQHRYYLHLFHLLCYIIPTYLPVLWGEQKWNAFFIAGVLRLTLSLHATFSINSVAHMWGTKPYDKDIQPVEAMSVLVFTGGEGYHNYHHTFPWDYKSAELGGYINLAMLVIDLMAKIGWAYDLRTVTKDIIEKRVQRTGDGTHPYY